MNWTGVEQRDKCINQYTRTNKLEQLERLKMSDVPVVNFATYPPVSDPPWFPRTNCHQQGLDFEEGVESPDFWTEPTKSRAEYRVHVFRRKDGKRGFPTDYYVVRVGWKSYEGDGPIPEYPIRSRRNGWKIRYYADPTHVDNDKLKVLARWAIAVQGWDFGAVDILRKQDGSYVVLECNACPGLRDTWTLDTYTQYIEALLEEGE